MSVRRVRVEGVSSAASGLRPERVRFIVSLESYWSPRRQGRVSIAVARTRPLHQKPLKHALVRESLTLPGRSRWTRKGLGTDNGRDRNPLLTSPRTDAVVRSAGKILVVDDEAANVRLLNTLLTREGYVVVTASDGEEALAMVASTHPDLVLMDVLMPKLSGYDVCERIKHNPATRLTPVVLITALHEREHKIQGINAGADDFLTKPVDPHELRARAHSLVRLKRYTDDLDSAESVIMSLALVIEARDAYTDGHCQRLASYATTFGTALDLSEEELAALFRGGYLHDVGKIGMPDAILLKPGRAQRRASTGRSRTIRSSAIVSAASCDRCDRCVPSSGTTTSGSTGADIPMV